MSRSSASPTDQDMDVVVGNLLRAGVILSAAVVFAGGMIYLVRHGVEAPSYHVFRGEPADLRNLRGILQDAFLLRGRGVIQLGLLLLMATPVARVAYLVFAFERKRDRLYSVIASLVLILLLYGLGGGGV